jgi:polysaccharide chain length determinant protein (PEP-CTERM system associated)
MESSITQLKSYLPIFWARRNVFIVLTVTVAALIVGGSFFIQKKYEAKSSVFIEKNVIDSLMKGLTVTPSMNDRIRVLRYHMLSRDMVLRVLKKLGRDVQVGSQEELEQLVQSCQVKTSINIKGNDLFFVSIVHTDPVFAKDYINTLVTTYVEENISDKRKESYGANRFLSEQLAVYKQKLDAIEDEIFRYRKKAGIFSNVSEASLMEEIKLGEQELKKLKTSRNELLATLDTIREQLKMMQSMAAGGNSGLFDPNAMGGDPRVGALQARVDELLLVYNEEYPTIVKLREQIAELKKRQEEQPETSLLPEIDFNPLEDPIFVDLKMRMNSTQSEINALVARDRELSAAMESNKALLQNFPQDKKALADMERERNMYEDVYQKLLDRVGVSEVSKQMEVSDKSTTFRIVDPAILPTSPVGTKRILVMFLGVLAGLGAGIGGVLLLEMLDDTVKGPDPIKELGITVLAEIPLMHSEADTGVRRKRDRLVYAYGTLCMAFVSLMMLHDLLHLGWIDRIISSVGLMN